MANRTVSVKLMAEVSGYVAGLRTAHVATKDFATELDKAARAGRLDAVADQATALGLGLVGVAAGAVTMAARFDKAMSAVDAATHASATEMEQLRAAAIQAGKDTAYSATEAAGGIEELAKAGVATADILGGGLSGALSLAAAGEIDVAEAAETAASTLTQFGLKGRDVGHVADLLAAAAGKAQGSVRDMSQALNQSGLVAAQVGLSVEETTGTLAAFASAGLMGSDSGTSFKTMLQRLVAPTGEVKALMQDLGISAFDASGEFVGMSKFAGVLQGALSGMTSEQRNAALATIFGADAIRAASIVYSQGQAGIQGWIDKTNDSGYAAETARRKTDNLIGDLDRLRGELETLAIQSGGGANSGLRVLTQGAEALVAQFGELPPVMSGTVTVLAALSGAALLGAAGWVRMRRTTADALAELRATGPAGTRAATGLQAAGRWAGRAATAFVALEVASAALSSMVGSELNPQVDALGKGLASWGRDGKLAGEAARVLGDNMDDLAVGLKFLADTDNSRRQWARRLQDSLESVVPGLDATNTSLTKTRERVEAMDQALAGLVQGGDADAAAAAFGRLADAAAKDGVSVEELRALFPAYAAAVETAGSASTSAAGGVRDVGEAAGQSAEQVKKLNDAFDALFGAQMGIDEATIKYRQGLIDLKAELTSGARTLNLNTEEGRKNASAVLDQIKAIKDLRDARYAETGSLDAANAAYQRDIRGLQASMRAAGFTEAQIRELTDAYLQIPDQAKTQVSAPGAKAATQDIKNFIGPIAKIPPHKDTRVTVSNVGPSLAELAELRRYVNSVPKYIKVHAYVTTTGDIRIPGQGTITRRWGGVTEHAQDGLLREAQIASPVSPARYGWAEPATGGEAFIPRYGDLGRSRAIWAQVGQQWLGMRPAGGSTTVVNVSLSAGVVGSQYELETWLTGAVDSLRRKGRM